MPDNVDKLFEIMQAKGAASDRGKFRKVFLTPGNKGYKIRKDIYDGLRADGIIDSPTYEDFRRKLRLGGTPTVNKYRQQMFNSVDPNKSRASELTHRAVGQAVRATNNVRKPVTAKVVNQKGKPTGEEFAITPAKTVEDLDREYAQETTKNWENELHNQMADADRDAAKISDIFKSFIGSTDEVGSVWGNMTRGGGIAGTPHSVTTNNGIMENTEARQILAAGDYNRKRRELLQLEQDSRNGAIFDNHSFFRGMYDAAKDTGFLTGGASDLINAGSLLATKQDLDNGVHTEAGDMLMQQAVKNSNAQSQYGDNQGWMYTGGVITTNMSPFMMQVASAGFSKGLSTSIGKVVQGAASKVALGTMKKAAGFASADLAKNIGKFTGLTTKAFGKAIQYGIVGAAQANTVGLGNVANDVINRYTGQVYQDEQGNYKFGTFDSDGNLVHEGGEDFLTALVKGEAAQTIEFATELAGGGIDAAGTALKNFVTKGGKKIINKYNMENVSKVIDFLLNNKVAKNARYLKAGADRTLGKVEVNSIVGESLEEELGIIANTVFTGDNKISDLWDEKQQSQIWGGMLLSIGLMKGAVAPFHAYNAKQYYSYKHKLDKADVNLSQLLGKEKWEELRNQIDATTNDDMPEMVNKINRDVALGKNRQPVREYIQNLLIMRGYDIGNMLAAKKAIEDKGEGVSVKNMEKNQAYQQGRDAYGYDTHEIQLDQEDKLKSLAQLLGISEQQLASMSDEEFDALSGRDDNIDRAIYDYQLSSARYEGVIDNARDQIDLEVQRAAQAVDMYTDKSRNTIRNATIKATGGLEDYGVYIINGNIATHEDGSIDISNSDDMILYYDPTTNTVEHADAMMFAELGSEENADEVRSQAMADAKEKAIKETTGIIDGVVEVGTQFKTVDADGTEHTYEVLADNGDGTAMITIDGNIPTELVKGENVNIPVSFEELQKMKDESDQQRLQAAKAQREQMEKERAEQQNQETEETQPSFDFKKILNDNGNVVLADVLDEDGNTRYPNSKLFLIRDSGAKAKVMELTSDGSLIPHAVNKKDVRTATTMTLDEYKQAFAATSMIEDNSGVDRGEIEVEAPTIEDAEPIGTGAFGNIYNQFKGKVKEAFNFLMSHKSGDLLGVFHRDDVGDIDLVWGNEKMGLAHILGKHVGEGKDFETPDDAIAMIENVINSGRIFQDNQNRYTLMLDGVGVGIRKSFDGEKKNWIVTAVDFNRSQEEKGIVTNPTSTSHGVTESESAAALNDSDGKDINNSANDNENNESLTFEDGTPIPVDENGETDLSQTDAAHAAEWYDNNLGEDADDWLDGEIKKAKKVLEQAQNKKVTGTKPSELVASKKEKEAAIADAQAHYDSAISIRDSLKERRIAKEENTAEGRKELIEKARRKFARLKSAVKDDAEAVAQLYKETVGTLLHRLYDGTGIDVTDTIPLTAEEYVASNLGAHSLNYEGTETSKGVKQETGLNREDFAKTQLLAADGKGTTIDALVHSLWENRPSNLDSLDTQDIRNAMLSIITSGFKASEARNYIENLRIAQAENILEEQKKAADNHAFAEEQKAESESQTETAPESEEKTGEENSDEINDEDNEKINEQTNENINAPEVPEDATEENPLGLQLSEDKVPFEIEGGKSGETYNINDNEDRQRLINDNKVDDKDILDIDMPKHVHKAIKELCKKMGLKVQFLYMGARSNGWIENGTMYLALDTEKATQFVFGHEMTHAIKQKNPEAYKELVKVAMAVTTRKKFEEDLAKVYQNYYGISGYNNIDDYVEEVVADNLGKFINDFDLAQKFSLRLNHPVLATILHAIQKIKSLLYGDFYKSVDALERIVEKAYVDTAKGEVTNSETGEDVSFSLRLKSEPKKKGVGYKVFVLKDGKLYPPMVANPDGAATPVGVWLDADAAPIAGESKTGRPQVKQGGKGTQGGSGKLAYRPGWHLGVVPYAIQFNRKDAEGNKTLFPKNFVFAEVEYAADVDYQEEARQEGINPSGKYQHSLAGLKHLPTDGYYMYRTNPNPETDPWVITGAMKVNRILTRAEQAELVKNAGREPQQIQEGDIVTDDVVNSINQEIADAPKFSLKVYHGTGANFDRFDTSHAYEGAGSETFGHGIYVTKSAKIGASYALKAKVKKIKTPKAFKAIKNGDNWFGRFIDNAVRSSFAKAKKETFNRMDELIKEDENIVNDETKPEWKQNAAQKELADFEKLKSLFEGLTEEDIPSLKRAKANRYEVEIPDDTGNNYLDWNKPMKKEQKKIVREGLEKLGVDVDRLVRNGYSLDKNFGDVYNGLLYYALNGTKFEERDSFVASSNFLSSLGFTGIKYYAGTIWGGAKKGDLNYVIFNEDDAKIVGNTKFSLKKVNDAFNQRLDELVKNPNQKDKILRLGRSSSFLKASGIADADIELEFDKFVRKSGDKYKNNHPFNASDLKNLPMAIAEPIAVFKSTNANDHVVLTELQKDGKNFIVAIRAVEQHRKGGVVLEVNQITSLYPKEEKGIINWVNTGRISNVDKEKALHFIEALQPHAGTSITDEELKSAANIINSFETAKENVEKFSLKDEKIKSVAEKFGVNEDDVAMYANAVERGSTAEAARARANIKRYLLQANEDKISSFKELMKYTVPVNEALKENFGDLDAMIEERRKQVEAQRNAMEAARKRAQEEEEKRQKHLDELSLIPTDELDKRYMDAIANNDESTAREMLDESARRKGYGDVDSDYQGQGAWAAPSNPQYESDEARRADIENSPDVNLEDIALGYSLQPDDYFDNPRAYMNNTAYGLESAHVIKNALDAIKNGEKDVKVKVYRAVPTSVKEGKLRNGDWVTPSKKYAEMHGDNRLEGKYRIIEDEVPANQLWWDGNDANEFGFDDGKEYRYKNAKNNRKLNDLITYDNKGNVIPPSKRFNSRKNDIRFSLAGERGAAAADKAEERTTRMDFLSVARKMEDEKKDAKAIKIATGWERGADGKWRFEIPDFHFNYEKWKDNNKELLDSMDDKDYRNIMRYEKEFYEDLSPIRKKNFDELRSRTGYKIKQELTLGDVLEGKGADTLFKYYPELRDVKFKFSNLGAATVGIYDSKTKTIEVNDALLYSPRKAERNLQHEVQHVIQHLEGFAKGGNQFQVRGEVKKKFSEVIKQIRQLRAEGKEDEAKAIVEKNRGLYNAYTKNDDYNSYKALAGEVEARNVQERMNMTPEERRKTLAESTEDVARKDQIFLGVGDVSFSLRDMADGKESGAADIAEDLKSLNTPDEVDDAIKTAIEDMPSGWRMANRKMIHIAQALGENRKAEIAGEEPKFSLKDGTLIKAGTYFSGGGLVEEGLKGIIDPVVAVEYDEKISGVYRNNFGQHIVTADVRDVDPKELVKQIDGEVEYFHASPVCKNYSQAKSNHAEVELDKETAASTAEFINAIKPNVVTIENVKGYKDSDAMKTITDALDANGYTWDADVYNAADYGGYTNRERLIVRAVRDGKLPEKPKKMEHKSGWYEAVADIIPTLTEKKNGVAPWMDIRLKADGIDWRNIDKPLYVMGSAYADGKIPHAFADELLPTLRTKSGDVIVMPDGKVYRAMGRVLARVSGVSDDYKMPFSENLSHTIIGNGIPTQLTEHVIAPLLTGSDPKFSIRTYHGTGASFDKFDFSHMGEGEGSQAFGWGGYVTNSKDIAEDYTRRAKIRKDNGGFEFVTDMSANNKDMVRQYIYKHKDVNKGLDAMRKDLSSALEMFPDDDDLKELSNILAKKNEEIAVPDNIAYLYDVDIPDDNGDYLDWDAPLTDKQKNTIIKELRRLKIDFADFKKRGFSFDGSFGGNAYDFLMYALRKTKKWKDVNASRAVSKFLSSIGFTGIKYKAGTIFGGAKEGDTNYVIFDENNANIVGNTRFSLRYDQFEHDLNQWKKDNNLPKDAQRPTIPQRNAGESAVDFLRRVDDYRKQMALWKTAPTYEQHLLSNNTALGEFNRELQRGSVLKRIAFQDSMLAIRKAQEAIMKEVGVDRLNMAEDAYTAENRSHGKGKNEFEEYNNEFLQPLRKAYHQMKKILGDSYDNVRIYMMAKHGLERDAQMAFKKSLEVDYEDVAQRSAAYKAYKGDMNRIINDSDLEFGRINFTTWRQRDNALRVKYSPSFMNYRYDKMGIAYDYSGLSALFDGSDFEEAAHKLIKDIESKYVTETHNLWDATNAATKKILRDGYKAGMMSKDTYQYVRDMYSHYIPLRGWDGTTADQVWDYIGGGKGAFNQTLKTANGRTSIADDPIAYIENMAESGILLNNKNWVKQHLMLLAQNHPTSLLTLSKAWYVKSTDANGNEEWIPATPQITSQMNSNQVKAAIDAFEKKMEQMAQTGDATQQREGLNIAYPQTHSEEREHEVRVMKDGEEYVIYVNGDPQLAQAMNNTRAHRVSEGIKNSISKRVIAVVGRKMAAAYTSLSPLFIPSNYFRDLTMTLASTAIREDAKYNYLLRKNLATSWNLGFMLKDYQNGKLREKVSNGNATPKEQMFYDFMMNGGETGFVSSLDVEDLKKKFKNDLKDLDRWKANPVKVGHIIMDCIEFLNRMIEDSNRFAIYMTSIQYGRSIDEAVNDAKDVTLNFNRKGTGEHSWQTIRNLYLFINPAVQSLQTLGALAKHHPFKFTAVTASWLASGVLVPIVNVALMQLGAVFCGGDGDDKDWYKDISKKYWQFTKWDRRNNFIMWVPTTHEFVKIPLAQEFRAFYGVGDMIASKMMGGELAEESWSQYAEDLLGQVVDMLPLDPTGYDGNIAVSLMPNAIRPVFELAFNVDFTGKPLFKETEYNKYDPNFTKAYVGTPDWLVRASKMVNSIGNDYPDVQQNSIDAFGDPRYNLNNPAVVDHVLSSYLGGAYTMGSQVLGLITKSLNDQKEIKMADIPVLSKFVSNPDDRPVTKKQGDEFWNMKENHDRAANTLSKLKKQAKVDGDYSMLERFYGSEEYKQYKQDDVKVKKYEEDKKKERAEESGEEYRPHKLNAEDIYKAHATPKDDFEDLKLKQLYTKLNGFKTSYDLLVDTAPSQSDSYYNTNKVAIDAIDEISLDKQEISELKKGFLDDGKDAYNAEDMNQIRELRKNILSVLEKANKVVVAKQKAKAEK